MKYNRKIAFLLSFALCLSLLAGCGAGKEEEPVATPEPTPVATPAPRAEEVQVEEIVAEEPVELTPADRAAAKGLPAPPDVDITSWEFKIANSYNNILIYVPPYATVEGQGIDKRIADVTVQLVQDARAAGLRFFMASIFRNYEFQNTYYIEQVYKSGNASDAAKVLLGPGCSEHQTGLGFDVTADPMLNSKYAIFDNSPVLNTDTYAWMLEHCTEYGYILRYPEGKEQYYGTPCTAGHFRYVGVEAAKYIMDNDLCLEEFILLYDEDAIYVPGIN